jgi:hypothetical protein
LRFPECVVEKIAFSARQQLYQGTIASLSPDALRFSLSKKLVDRMIALYWVGLQGWHAASAPSGGVVFLSHSRLPRRAAGR